AYAHVVAAFRTDMKIALHFRAIEHAVAGVAFRPNTLRHAAALLSRGVDTGRYKFSEPVHRFSVFAPGGRWLGTGATWYTNARFGGTAQPAQVWRSGTWKCSG